MQRVSFSNSAPGVIACGLFAAVLAMPSIAMTDAETKALAKKSQNPVAKMISVPFEYNFNGEFGPNNGKQHVLNVKPVLPVAIGENWNLINRVIMPYVSQPGIPGGPNRQNGLGDTTYQGFISPASPGKVIWGAGPTVQMPTHTDEVLGNENWVGFSTGASRRSTPGWPITTMWKNRSLAPSGIFN